MDTATAPKTLNITDIMGIIPHRPPFLLVDKAVIVKPEKKIAAYKGVTMNEPFFAGHFPGKPIMPGVLMIEAIAQAGGALLLTEYSDEDRASKLMVFTGIDDCKFRRPVVPGDQVRIEVSVLNWRSSAVRMRWELLHELS